MTIVKINLHKVHAERKLGAKGGQIRINNNVSLKDIEDLQFNIPGKAGLKFTFSFTCTYEPDFGSIEVEGQVFYTGEEKEVKSVKQDWDKEKRIPVGLMEKIVNASLHKGNIEAIKISEEVGLPSPLPLPKMKANPAKTEDKPKAKPKAN